MAGSSSHQIRNICVFGGSIPGKEKVFLELTNHLGQVLAERKIHLVYGGGNLGLMRGVSITAFLGGSHVLGVIPKALAKKGHHWKNNWRGTTSLRNVSSNECNV
jgi:predicted Rossmann-fold nucleotide-binding protein